MIGRQFLAVFVRLMFACAFLASGALGQSDDTRPIYCDQDSAAKNCSLIQFDRPGNRFADARGHQLIPNHQLASDDPLQPVRQEWAWAINSAASKVLYSGTVISVSLNPTESKTCTAMDWKLVLLSAESSNLLIYGPADISEFCGKEGILFVVPVAVEWVQVFHYPGNTKDPLRKAPGPAGPPDASYCEGVDDPVYKSGDPYYIRPCDWHTGIHWVYWHPLGMVYNRLTQPGTSQGTISFTPAIGKVPAAVGAPPGDKAPAEALNFDIQLYPSGVWGPGWIGFPIIFEKANTNTANLNSLIAGLSYDFPTSHFWPCGKAHSCPLWSIGALNEKLRLTLRPPDFRIQYGTEMATSSPHDINLVASATIRLPLAIDLRHQPSSLTLFPVAGIEGGNHIHTHITEDNDILRKVVGFDASVRLPFVATHAFLGDKPLMIDFSWRTRYLSYAEPFTDYVSGVAETLTKQQRSYWRGSCIVPVSTLVQFKVTVQHGGLPPDFYYLGYSVNLGLTFGNPGYSEH